MKALALCLLALLIAMFTVGCVGVSRPTPPLTQETVTPVPSPSPTSTGNGGSGVVFPKLGDTFLQWEAVFGQPTPVQKDDVTDYQWDVPQYNMTITTNGENTVAPGRVYSAIVRNTSGTDWTPGVEVGVAQALQPADSQVVKQQGREVWLTSATLAQDIPISEGKFVVLFAVNSVSVSAVIGEAP